MASEKQDARHPLISFNDTLESRLKEVQEMELETIELIHNYSSLQQNKQRQIEIAKSQINECFDKMIESFKAKQSQLVNELDNCMVDEVGDNLFIIPSITTLINDQKRCLSQQLMRPPSAQTDARKILHDYDAAKQLYDAYMTSIQQSMSTISASVAVHIDKNRLSQICGTLKKLIKIDTDRNNADASYAKEVKEVKQEQEQQSEQTPNETPASVKEENQDLNKMITDLEKKLEVEKERNKRVQSEYLGKIAKYLSMDGGNVSGVGWYDTNSTNSRIYQNWEPVLCTTSNMIDSRGKSKNLPHESFVFDVPNVANLGEFHSCVSKLKNGYIKWITSIAVRKEINNTNVNTKRGKIFAPDAEDFIYQYAIRNELDPPSFMFTKNESKKGGNVEGKLTFCGQTFVSSARKKKAAREMCFKLAMSHLMR